MANEYEKSAWITQTMSKDKPWGSVTTWSALPSIFGKMLKIRSGCRTSLKYNNLKDEAFFVMSGRVKLTYADEEWLAYKGVETKEAILSAGQAFIVMSRCVYRLEALEESEIIEIANRGGRCAERLADDYGRQVLETDLPNEIPE